MERISETIRQIQNREISTPHQTKIIPSHFSRFAEMRGNELVFEFKKCLDFMAETGKELFGSHFRIYQEDHNLIYKLLVYAIRDGREASRLELNLQKGILLSGPVGCGKTCLMTLLRYFQLPSDRFALKSCREISFEFIRNGFEVIDKYGSGIRGYGVMKNGKPKVYCFDDLGTEQSLKYYGNECNVMGEILLSRYDLFVNQGARTHLTTNLSASEIEGYYGNRIRSRMREMVNVLGFGKDAKDKRL